LSNGFVNYLIGVVWSLSSRLAAKQQRLVHILKDRENYLRIFTQLEWKSMTLARVERT
jgi:hypothetical protein